MQENSTLSIIHQYGVGDLESLLKGDIEPGLFSTNLPTAKNILIDSENYRNPRATNLLGVYRRYVVGDYSEAESMLDKPLNPVDDSMMPHPELVHVAYGDKMPIIKIEVFSEELFDESKTRLKFSHYGEIYTETLEFENLLESVREEIEKQSLGNHPGVRGTIDFGMNLRNMKEMSGLNSIEYRLFSIFSGFIELYKRGTMN
jgi:hypothetical protein